MEINCTKRAHIIINIHEEYGSWNNIIYVLGREHKSVRLFFSFFFLQALNFPYLVEYAALTRQIPRNKQRNLHYNGGERITPR